MTVNTYAFGRITIDGTEYTSDVIVFPQRVQTRWWRKEGHSLCTDDLLDVLKEPPQVLVIGTGYYGQMKVPEATQDALKAQGIDVRIHETRDAVEELNRLQRECARVIAALHLTC